MVESPGDMLGASVGANLVFALLEGLMISQGISFRAITRIAPTK